MWKRKKATYLPHPGHSYFYADNGGPFVFVSPKTTFTPSVCVDFDSCIRHERRHRCNDIKCRGRLHKRWSVPLFVSSHVFFPLPWNCWDLDRRCAVTGRRRRRAPPPYVPRDLRWFPYFCFLQHANLRRGHISIFPWLCNRHRTIRISDTHLIQNKKKK